MSYSLVDPILSEWAANRGLSIMNSYKDSEVRSIDLAYEDGSRFQIYIDPPGRTKTIGVHVWDYGERREDFEVELGELANCLDLSLRVASRWAKVTPE